MTTCPLCKSELQPDGSLWYCPNIECHLFSHPIRRRGWDAISALTAPPRVSIGKVLAHLCGNTLRGELDAALRAAGCEVVE